MKPLFWGWRISHAIRDSLTWGWFRPDSTVADANKGHLVGTAFLYGVSGRAELYGVTGKAEL